MQQSSPVALILIENSSSSVMGSLMRAEQRRPLKSEEDGSQ